MEYFRERLRSGRDRELERKGKLKEERKGLTIRDERVQAVFQRLDSDLKRAPGMWLPVR